MDLKCVKDIWKNNAFDILTSELTVIGTVNIVKLPIYSDDFSKTTGESIDPTRPEAGTYRTARGLDDQYRVRFLVIESHGMRDLGKRFSYNPAYKFEPYDMWVMCKTQDLKFVENIDILDYVDTVNINGDTYKLRGRFNDWSDITHIFLEKKAGTSE